MDILLNSQDFMKKSHFLKRQILQIPDVMVLLKGECGQKNTSVFLMRAKSTEIQVLLCVSSHGQIKPNTVFLQFYKQTRILHKTFIL